MRRSGETNPRRWVGALACLLIAAPAARAAEPVRLVSVRPGRIPVILAAPHGGSRPVPGVPVRAGFGAEQFLTERDDNTAELAELIADELQQRLRARPYLVIARFERKYIDANRPEQHALEADAARPCYRAYHRGLEEFTRELQAKWKCGLLLDIHGQGGRPDCLARGTNNGQTVELLLKRHGKAALTGPRSILGVVAGSGFKVFPPNDSDEPEDRRYAGGHTVRTYGSHQGAGIDAIQLEFGSELRQRSRLKKVASVMAEAIDIFCREYMTETIH